ncbi:MAG: lipid-A-disaccharide synthase, partial [Pedosphaera parvula]|nr:lipid-A-disaccharide synthase [Pedosphaera parvula]
MSSPTFMLVAGEVSGDINATELVQALRRDAAARGSPFPPRFFGAGGPRMAAAGVVLAFDLTRHAVIGPWEVFKNYSKLKRTFDHLLKLAIQRQPEVIILVDFSGFNLRVAAALRKHIRQRQSAFTNGNPKIVYYVSPQVWASRPDRVIDLARDVDLVLSIFPFEKEWYARRAPQLPVEFVGHPMVDRYGTKEGGRQKAEGDSSTPLVLLLPGSRAKELSKHLPVMLEAARTMQAQQAVRVRVILPNPVMEQMTRQALPKDSDIEIRMGALAVSLAEADLAIAKSGTVTLEGAFFGVPTVVMYIT